MAANSLQIRVLLSALDKVTAPMKRIMAGSNSTARALKAARDQVKALNAQQNDISSYTKQHDAVRQTGEELARAQQRLKQYQEQLKAMNAPSAAFQKTFINASAAVEKLKNKHGEQRAELQRLIPKLREAGVNTRNLSESESQLKARIDAANAAYKTQQQRMGALAAKQEKLAKVRAAYAEGKELAGSSAMLGASSAATGAALGGPIIGIIKNYSSFEDAMLGVAKQVEGARDDNGQLTSTYYEMGEAIKKMSETIPMASTEIAALVEGGARMGIQGKDNLLEFAHVAANAATAFEIPADEIGENLARIASLFKIPIKNVSQLGDVINYLDDNAQSKGGDIIEVMQRIAGVTASVGMNYKDAAALGSTFLTLGASAEVAGTATNAMIRELAIANEQPKRFKEGLKALGMESKKVQSSMAKDATGTILKVLDALKKLPQEQQLTVATQLFGKEYGDDASKLANNLEEYRRQLELTKSTKGNGSMQRESDIRGDALSARAMMSQNRLFNLSADLGKTLRPALIEIMDMINGVLEKINAWAKANPELVTTILKVAAGVAAASTAFGALALGLAGILGPGLAIRFMLAQIGVRLPSVLGLFGILGRKELPAAAQSMGLFSRSAARVAGLGQKVSAAWKGAAIEPGVWTRGRAVLSGFGATLASLPGRFTQAASGAANWAAILSGRVVNASRQALAMTWSYAAGVAQSLRLATTNTLAYVRANGLLGTSLNLLKGSWTGLMGLLRGGASAVMGGAAAGLRLVGQAVLFVSRALLLNPIGLLITALALGAVALIKYWQPVKAFFTGLWQGFTEGLAPLQPMLGGIGAALAPLKPIWEGISAAMGTAWRWVSQLFQPFQATATELEGATQKGRVFGQWLAGLVNLLAGLPAQFVNMGGMLIDGLVNGMTAQFGKLKDTVSNMASSSIDWFKEKMGIHSPSRVFAELGGFTMAGLTVGLAKNEDGPLAQMAGTAKRLAAAGAVAVGVGTAATPALAGISFDDRPPAAQAAAAPMVIQGDTVTIHLNVGAGVNAKDLAQQIGAVLDQREREKAARLRSRLSDKE